MKKILFFIPMLRVILITTTICFTVIASAQQSVAINTDGTNADNSALLDIKSNSKGILIPRLTAAEKTAISSPATGLLIYQTNTSAGFYYYNGSSWTPLTSAAQGPLTGWATTGNTGTDSTINFIGTTDDQPLIGKVNGEQVFRFSPSMPVTTVGYQAGKVNTGNYNTFFGYQAGLSNTSGTENHFNGYQSGLSNTIGKQNYFSGMNSGKANTTGNWNHFEGFEAGRSNISGGHNYFSGYEAGFNNTTSHFNQFIGYLAGYSNTSGTQNHFVGYYAGRSNITGNYNFFEGYSAGAANTSGTQNHFTGYNAGTNNTSGQLNYFSGYNSGSANTTGNWNQFEGFEAGKSNINGGHNYFSGFQAGYSNTTAHFNQFMGYQSGYANATGTQNLFIGYNAGRYNASGNQNVGVGSYALTTNTLGSNNTAIGYDADVSSDFLFNATAIGSNALVNASNKVVIGNTNVSSIGGYANWSNFSDARFKHNVKENVPGLSFITKLRPITYTLDVDGINDFNSKDLPADKKLKTLNSEKKNEVFTGFMAQEVEEVAKSLGYNFSGVDKPQDASKQTYALRYSDFVVPLVKAIQEQQKQIDELKKMIELLSKK